MYPHPPNFIPFAVLVCLIAPALGSTTFVEHNFQFIEHQLPVALKSVPLRQAELKAQGKWREGLSQQCIVRNINKDGSLNLVGANDWTSGFFPGLLWYTYEYTQDAQWAEAAEKYTALIEGAKRLKGTHDLGFMIYCSFGNAYRLTAKEEYKQVVIEAANSLITRFDPQVGLIRSWDFNKAVWNYPVIVDNMMNLEMLCEVSKMTGDRRYRDIALSHADKTMQNHYRADFSSYHVVDYDSKGKAVKFNTHQGYADDSAWARGQSWGLYGFTMMYRETREARYLDFAQKIAHFILNHPNLPDDKVPYWDYDAPDIPHAPRDVSAACIMASALYELSTYGTGDDFAQYKSVADTILNSVSTRYLSKAGGDYGFITKDSVGSLPGGVEISVPINYADYYFAEALLRKKGLEEKAR